MLVIPVIALAARRAPTPLMQRLGQLSFLTYVAFLTATIGGGGTLVSLFVTDSIRGWNRMSIFIALLSLAALGLLLDQAAGWAHRRIPALRRTNSGVVTTLLAAVVLLVGAADQSQTSAVPNYRATADEWQSTETFVRSLQSSNPAGSMIFQLPYMPYPESGSVNGVSDGDQLNLYLHGSDLRWSGGGIKGRPQSDWPGEVSRESPEAMTVDLATVGFQGIVVDRAPLADAGSHIDAQLSPLLGAPSITSPNQRYVYYSLGPVIDRVNSTTTPEHPTATAAAITHSDATG